MFECCMANVITAWIAYGHVGNNFYIENVLNKNVHAKL